MYKEFYKLRRNPFEITPDPSFLFLTQRHREALANLYYGVRRRKGFVVLTGEVGTGKTLLVSFLLQLLKESGVAYAYVFNGRLSALELLQYVALDLGLASPGTNKAILLHELSKYLIARYQKKLTTVIVVDDAHCLATDALEEVRLLTNLETPEQKLLQVLLVGQPELVERLDSLELRPLKQRVALRASLEPFDLEETRGYIRRRLHVAGAVTGGNLIPDETIATIYRFSRGIPRLINTICENALVTAYARHLTEVTSGIIEETAYDLHFEAATLLRIEPDNGDDYSSARSEFIGRSHARLKDVQADHEQCRPFDTGLQR